MKQSYPICLIIFVSLLLFSQRTPVYAERGLPCTWANQLYLPWFQQAAGPTITGLIAPQQPPAAPRPLARSASPLALTPDDQELWVVNPDAGSVTVVATGTQQKVAEISIGGEPWSLAMAPTGERLYVLDRAQGRLVVLDRNSRQIVQQIRVDGEAGMVVLSPSGAYAFVTSAAASAVLAIDTTTLAIVQRWPVAPLPHALAMSNDGDGDDWDETIVITHLTPASRPGGQEATDDGRQGLVTLLRPCAASPVTVAPLLPDAHGFPTLLTSVAIFEQRAWVALQRASPALPNSLTQTLFAATVTVDLTTQQEDPTLALPLNDQTIFGSPINNPWAVALAPDGRYLYLVAAGSDLVEVIDIRQPDAPQLVKFLPVGRNPRGIVLNRAGDRAYVLNFLSRSVTVLDLTTRQTIGEVNVTAETLTPTVLLGKILFNNATNPKLSRGGWIACASCHPDGGTDNITWIFPDGPRQTPPLWNATQTLPWHWSAALDEAQDVESTVEAIQHGLGLAPGVEPPLLGPVNTSRSTDLDALAAYLEADIRLPTLSLLAPDSSTIAAGRQLFLQQGCPVCHGGLHWTASQMPGPAGTLDPDANGMVDGVLRQVGTMNPQDIRGATGFDPPALLGAALTAPYLHDGSRASLEAIIRSGHPQAATPTTLTTEEVTQLALFLQSIDKETEPFVAPTPP